MRGVQPLTCVRASTACPLHSSPLLWVGARFKGRSCKKETGLSDDPRSGFAMETACIVEPPPPPRARGGVELERYRDPLDPVGPALIWDTVSKKKKLNSGGGWV